MNDYVRAYEGKEPYIFVSYAHKDRETVLPIIRELYNRKYRVWYDEGIAPGSEWPHNIETHLLQASAVMIFISGNSLASLNCENEVTVAVGKNKSILAVSLDSEAKHPMIIDTLVLKKDTDLVQLIIDCGRIGDEFIGDGISGYQYTIVKKRSFNFWNLMLCLAAMLAVVVSVSLYGLYNGWFDKYLPAKQQPILTMAAPAVQQEQTVAVINNIIGSVLPVKFSFEEEKQAVYQKLGWKQPNEMTYNDLMGMKGLSRLDFSRDELITDISFTAFLPDLEFLSLMNSQVVDLTPLIDCQKLKTVQITVDMLPMKIPDMRSFEIEVR